jgi:hypothetical protein
MSVPLDRLYDFLDDIVDQDLIIYRWIPHGSRKLTDLQPLRDYDDSFHLFTTPMAIFHDQEPLDFDLYDLDCLINAYQHYQPSSSLRLCFDRSDHELMRLIWDMHIRGIGTTAFANVHDYTVLVHSELRSAELEKFKQQSYLPVYYWSHAVIARDWYRYAQHDPRLNIRSPTKDFLIYNRSWTGSREYRLMFAQLLAQHNLHLACVTSFHAWCEGTHYSQYQFCNPEFAIEDFALDQRFDQCQASSAASADYCVQDYQSTRFEIVLETVYDDERLHLTEKILRPIACGHPFVLMSTPGSLEYLRSYGFQTFGDYWDESYDQIIDSKQRMLAVIDLMQQLASRPDKDQLCQQVQAVCEHNRARFFSQEFFDQVLDEYRESMHSALDQIQQHRTGAFFRRMLRYLHRRGHAIWPDFMPRQLAAKLWQHLKS